MREPGRPGGGRSVGEGGGAGQHRKCARESGGEGAEAGQHRECAREGRGAGVGVWVRVGGAGKHRKCAREGGGAQRQGSTGSVQRRMRGADGCPKQVQKKAWRLEMGFEYRLSLHSSPHLQGKLTLS